MEKYHDWRDAYTGIHPFLPAVRRWGILGLLRFPFVFVLLALVLVMDALVPFLRWLWAWLLVRPLLLVSGCWLSVTHRGAPNCGSVFFCNHKGYLDLLCAAVVSPSNYCFVFGDVMTVHSSLLSALLFVVARRSPSSEAKIPISKLKELRRVVCFPEGASTNHEKCLLALDEKFGAAVDEMKLSYSFLLFSFSEKCCAFFSEESFFKHFLSLISVPWQSVRVTQFNSEKAGFQAGWEKMSAVSGHKMLKLDWQDKNDFVEKWNAK